MSARSLAGLRTASELLRGLSQRLAPLGADHPSETLGEEEDDWEENADDWFDGEGGSEFEDSGGGPAHRDPPETVPLSSTVAKEHGNNVDDLVALVQDLRVELAEQRRRHEARILELEEENRKLVSIARRSKEKIRSVEQLALSQIAQERALCEEQLLEAEERLEEERRKHRREMYDLETIHKDQLMDVRATYEAWADGVEEESSNRLRLAEEERHNTLDRVAELEELLRAAEVDRAAQAEEYERRLLEEQVARRDLQLEYENKLRQFKEAHVIQSRRRVSQALDAIAL